MCEIECECEIERERESVSLSVCEKEEEKMLLSGGVRKRARRKTDKLTNSHLEIDRSIDEHIIQEPPRQIRGMRINKMRW